MVGKIHFVQGNEVEMETSIGKVVGGWLGENYPFSFN